MYVVYLSGQGFDWPWLSWALPVTAYAGMCQRRSAARSSCLFVREIADLRRFSPRVYRVFGWMAVAFVVLAFANFAQLIGLGAHGGGDREPRVLGAGVSRSGRGVHGVASRESRVPVCSSLPGACSRR